MDRHMIDLDYYEIDREWHDHMDLLPVWNDDWEKRDPLRGKRGWTCRDYVNTAFAVCIVAVGLGLLAVPIPGARNTECRAHLMNLQRQQQEAALRALDQAR